MQIYRICYSIHSIKGSFTTYQGWFCSELGRDEEETVNFCVMFPCTVSTVFRENIEPWVDLQSAAFYFLGHVLKFSQHCSFRLLLFCFVFSRTTSYLFALFLHPVSSAVASFSDMLTLPKLLFNRSYQYIRNILNIDRWIYLFIYKG